MKHKHWRLGEGENFPLLILKAILQCLRITIMLQKCLHKLTLEIRVSHFCSGLTLSFQPFRICESAQFMAMKAKFLSLTPVGVAMYFHVKEWKLVQLWIDNHREKFPGENTPDDGIKLNFLKGPYSSQKQPNQHWRHCLLLISIYLFRWERPWEQKQTTNFIKLEWCNK